MNHLSGICSRRCTSLLLAVNTSNNSVCGQIIGGFNARQWHHKNLLISFPLGSVRARSSHATMHNYLPFFASGKVVSGYGRGSKELGIPTANYPLEVVKSLPDCFQTGIYYGWANIDNGEVHKMVMSVGWNPFYHNKEKSMETHILHNYDRDLYGCLLKTCIVGYLRPEQDFQSLEDLIACIKGDIAQAQQLLDSNESSKALQKHDFFKDTTNDNSTCGPTMNGL